MSDEPRLGVRLASVSDGAHPARPGGGEGQPRRRHPRAASISTPGPGRLGPRAHGRRDDPGVPRLPGPPHHGARADEGGCALRPRRQPRRGDCSGHADELEVRADGAAVWRRQGRRPLRPACALRARAGERHPTLHHRDHTPDRTGPRHPGPRPRHRRPDYGVDDGHLLHDPGPERAGRCYRQAAPRRRIAGAS